MLTNKLILSLLLCCIANLSEAADGLSPNQKSGTAETLEAGAKNDISGDELKGVSELVSKCSTSKNCLRALFSEEEQRASNASSVTLGIFGSKSVNNKYMDVANYYRYKPVVVGKYEYKIGIGFRIAANLNAADLNASGSLNGIGLQIGKPKTGKSQLRVDLLGINLNDSKNPQNNIYSVVPVAIDLTSDTTNKLDSAISERVKSILADTENAFLQICPQVIEVIDSDSVKLRASMKPEDVQKAILDANAYAAEHKFLVQAMLNNTGSCPKTKFPNATMMFSDDQDAAAGGISAVAGSANAGSKSNIAFQEYYRYYYDGEGRHSILGEMSVSGLQDTASINSIASAILNFDSSKSSLQVKIYSKGLEQSGQMLSDVSAPPNDPLTYIVNLYNGFQTVKLAIDKTADSEEKPLPAKPVVPESKTAKDKAEAKTSKEVTLGKDTKG